MIWFAIWGAACAFFLFCFVLVNRGMKNAPLLEDDQVTPETLFPAPEASAGPSAPLDNHGCYIEDDRTRDLREAYASRQRVHRSKRAIDELMRNVGRN